MAVNGITIAAGQQWRNRAGAPVSITRVQGESSRYPWFADEGSGIGYVVNNRGRYFPDDTSLGESPRDLVELIRDSVPLQDFSKIEERVAASIPNFDPANPYGVPATGDFAVAAESSIHPYHELAATLVRAFAQASQGKGKERHAIGDTPFHEQPMALINQQIGSVDGFIYQAHKKSLEALRLPQGRNVAELLGAINYLAGAVIALETWAKKPSEKTNASIAVSVLKEGK